MCHLRQNAHTQNIFTKLDDLCISLFFQDVADWALGTLSMKFTSSSISSLRKEPKTCDLYLILPNKIIMISQK